MSLIVQEIRELEDRIRELATDCSTYKAERDNLWQRIYRAREILLTMKSEIDGHFPTRVDPWVPWYEVRKALDALEGK